MDATTALPASDPRHPGLLKTIRGDGYLLAAKVAVETL